jgi:ferric-dicitrate binding protein FerR (iron transport regulator)
MEENKKIEEQWVSWITGESEMVPGKDIQEEKSIDGLEKTWELAGDAYTYRKSDPDMAWARMSEKMNLQRETTIIRRFGWLRVAAIFVAMVSLGGITYLITKDSSIVPSQMSVAKVELKTVTTISNPAEVTTVLLPDGSIVKMNASSTLEYPAQFAAGIRRVKLTGEAYFEVIHDASNPFVVELNNLVVEDLGTSFNISAYPDKRQVEVNVSSGSVRLRNKNANEEAVLEAGWHGKYTNASGKIESTNKLTTNYLSWITKEVSFRHTPLSSVFEELNNIYHVRIKYTDPKIANIPYTANFAKFELEDIINIIAKTNHLQVIKEAEGYVLASK